MKKKQKFTLIDIGTIKHYMGDYSVSTQISIKQREYLSILVHQQFTDITGKVSDELIEIEQGNSLFICNDIPTGYFLPSSFTGDFWDATNTTGVSRLFGMADQNGFDSRQMTALNGNEYDYRQNLVAKTIPSYAWRSLYTLYYTY